MMCEVEFLNPVTGEMRRIVVALAGNEIAKAKATDDPDLFLMTYALRRGYREVPDGFRHIPAPEGIRLLRAN